MIEPIEVSVCIVNYNAGKYIVPCLESIYAKTKGLTYEIIIVDNKSTDGSLEEIKLRFPKVRILESDENVGFARACNKAASAAIGEYILFLNPDTELKNNAIGLTFMSLRFKNREDVAVCKIVNPDGTLGISRKGELFFTLKVQAFLNFRLNKIFPKSQLCQRGLLNENNFASTRELYFVAGCFLLMQRSFFLQLGMFDERYFLYAEDDDLSLKIRRAGGRIIYFPEGEILHWEKMSSPPNSMLPTYYFLMNRYRFIMKEKGYFQSTIYRAIILFSSLLKWFTGSLFYKSKSSMVLERNKNMFALRWALGLTKRIE